MAFDGFFTRKIVAELNEQLLNGKITKIYQPFEQELQVVIRRNRQNLRLAASIHPVYYAMHLTEAKTSNPTHAPMFCMLLRKHLENAIILSIRQIENDRMIEFELSGRDELGDTQNYLLLFELMGKHSNILLVNKATQTIIDCIKHVPLIQNSYRSLQPGGSYLRPPQQVNQVNWYDMSDVQLESWSLQHITTLTSGQGQRVVQGMSKLLAHELAYRLTHTTKAPVTIIKQLLAEIDHGQPHLYQLTDKMDYYMLTLQQDKSQAQLFPSFSNLIETFYAQKIHLDRIKQVAGDLIQHIQQLIDKNYKKLEKLEADRQVAQDADLYRIKGELLNVYPYLVAKGQTSVELENFYNDNQPLLIQLDPRKTAGENSQQYFKRYSKYRDSLQFIHAQEQETTGEIDYLEGILVQLHQADIEDIAVIKQELIDQGYTSQRKQHEKKRSKDGGKPREFRSSDGVRILVGRNNSQNDELSLKKANKTYWWLHTKDIPGAHVIVEAENPSDQTLTEAAEIAAYYSKYQHSAQVPVDLVPVKALHKPNGAKPGFVIYTGQRTLLVTPEETRIHDLMVEVP